MTIDEVAHRHTSMSSPRLRSADGRSDREGEEESSPLTGLQRVCLPSGPPSGASWPRVRSSTRGCCPHCSPASPPSRAPGSSLAVPRRAGRNEAAASRGDPRRLHPPSLRQREVSSPIREPEDLLQRSTQPSLARIKSSPHACCMGLMLGPVIQAVCLGGRR